MLSTMLMSGDNAWNHMPCLFFCKDKDSIFRNINTTGLHSIGFNQLEEVIGYSDADLQPFQVKSERYRKQDCYTLEGNQQINIEGLVDLEGKKVLHLIQKSPWLNEFKQVIGIMGFGFTFTQGSFKNILSSLSALNLGFQDFANIQESKKIFIYGSYNFSYREAQVVGLLLKGHTIKGVCKILKLSPRTIEHYAESIRFKTNTKEKSDLMDKAFETGFIELMFANFTH